MLNASLLRWTSASTAACAFRSQTTTWKRSQLWDRYASSRCSPPGRLASTILRPVSWKRAAAPRESPRQS